MGNSRWTLAFAVLAMSYLVGCSDIQDASSEGPAHTSIDIEYDKSSEPWNLRPLFERTRRAFRNRSGVLRGGDATTAATISSIGEVSLTPYHWPSGSMPRDTSAIQGSEFRLETSSISRGRIELPLSSITREGNDGSAVIERGSTTEKIIAVENGIEQSWQFAQEPGTHGDLVVRIAVNGYSYTAHTHSGLHFVDITSGLGYAYGHATWIDNTGYKHAIAAQFDNNDIILRVPDEIVAASAYPAVLDPTVTAEYGFDSPVTGPAVNAQYTPDIAYSGVSGAEFMVVWSDYRRETSFVSDVFGARITASGSVVDPVGIRVPTTNIVGDQISPAIAWSDGGSVVGHWFIVWEDTGASGIPGGGMIRGARIDTGGTHLSPDFDVSNRDVSDNSSESAPDVAYNPSLSGGRRIQVVWKRSTGGIQVASYPHDSPSGGFSPTNAIVTTQPTAGSPRISNGDASTAFFVLWTDSRTGNQDVYGKTVSESLSLGIERVLTTNSSNQQKPAIASTQGNGWIAVWQDLRNGAADIYGQKISGTGELTGGNVAVSTAANDQTSPVIVGASGSNTWFVAWSDTRNNVNDIYGARVGLQNGVINVIDTSGVAISTAAGIQVEPSAATDFATNRFFVVWSDARTSAAARDILGARVALGDGGVIDNSGLLISTSANQQESPAITACAGKYLVVWTDTRNSFESPDIYGAITDTSNPPTVLVNNIAISIASGRQDLPAVACNGTDFFVVWADERNFGTSNRDIYGARVRASDGAVLDANGIVISSHSGAQTDPKVAFISNTYQVVWADRRGSNYDILGKRVSSAGVVDNASEVNVSGVIAHDQVRPTITHDNDFAFSTQRFFVAWQDGRNITSELDPNWDIYARYLSTTGALTGTLQITTGASGEYAPSAATRPPTQSINRLQFIVYERLSGAETDVYGTVVLPGSVANPTPSVGATIGIATAPNTREVEPVVAQRVADQMIVSFRTADNPVDFDFRINGQDIDVSPLALVGSAFSIANQSGIRERSPAVRCGTTANCQVAYRRYDDTSGSDRSRGRTVGY